MICLACNGSGITQVRYLRFIYSVPAVCGGCDGRGKAVEEEDGNQPLLDQIIDKWSRILGSLQEQEQLPDEARSNWCRRLVDVNLLDPQARAALHAMSSEINECDARPTRDVFLIGYLLRELADLCEQYQRSSREDLAHG